MKKKTFIPDNKVPAANFVATIAANVDNKRITDEQFREFIRNTLPIVEYERIDTTDDAD